MRPSDPAKVADFAARRFCTQARQAVLPHLDAPRTARDCGRHDAAAPGRGQLGAGAAGVAAAAYRPEYCCSLLSNYLPRQVLLVTTALKDARDWHRNEVLTIAAVPPLQDTQWAGSGVGAVVVLASAAQHDHEAIGAYQGEVALLSRRIVVQGADSDSPPTDVSPASCTHPQRRLGSKSVPCANTYLTGYGGHILADGPEATAKVRVTLYA